MALMVILAGVLLASSVTPNSELERVDVAYSELASGQAKDAVNRIGAGRETRDPTVLINLAAAYTRMGRVAEARQLLRAAIASPDRYDVELADGHWIDSRHAARIALSRLEREDAMFGG